jgi:hypothetical protein
MPDNSSFNLWQHKPWWCQPWTIILTGMIIVTASWFLINGPAASSGVLQLFF